MDDLKARLRDADKGSVQRALGSRIFGEAADRIEKLEAAGNALAETIKMTKASLVAGLTKRELGFLMDDLHKWNVATLSDNGGAPDNG